MPSPLVTAAPDLEGIPSGSGRWLRLLGCALVWLGLLGAGLRPGPALDELELARILAEQEALCVRALQVLEERTLGRLAAGPARARLAGVLEEARRLEVALARRSAAADPELGQAASSLGRDRIRQIVWARNLGSREGFERAEILEFLRAQGGAEGVALEGWLEAQLRQARRHTEGGPEGAFRRWQAALLPLRIEQARLVARVQRKALAVGPGHDLAEEVGEGRRLASRIAAVAAPLGLRAAQAAASREAAALADWIEAAEALRHDPSESSAERLQRTSEALRAASRAASQRALEAARAALRVETRG